MEWDSPAWRELRDANILRWCCGNHAAVQFVLDLNAVVETWDDLIDGDQPVSADAINAAFMRAMVGLPGNPFFQAHASALMPTVAVAINAWLDANVFEKSGDAHERMWAFFLRNLGMEVFIQVALLTGGPEHMRAVSVEMRRFFTHETYANWEHRHA